jgi:predicted nucleic acid-binding protein
MTVRGIQDRPLAFVDSSAYFAVIDASDDNHRAAHAISQGLQAARWRVFTSTYIVAETHALLLARLNRRIAVQFLDQMEQTQVRVITVTAADLRRAHGIIRQYDDKDFSLTDATSFAVMERLGIRYAFAFDRNFAQFGLTPLTVERLR